MISLSILIGQDADFDLTYNYNTIYLQQGLLGQTFVKGGESYSLATLGSELNQYPEAGDLYEKSFMMRMLGIGALIIGPVASSALVNTDESSFISVYLGALFLGIFATFESYNKLNEAIWVYNRESLKSNDANGNTDPSSNDWQWKKIQQ